MESIKVKLITLFEVILLKVHHIKLIKNINVKSPVSFRVPNEKFEEENKILFQIVQRTCNRNFSQFEANKGSQP